MEDTLRLETRIASDQEVKSVVMSALQTVPHLLQQSILERLKQKCKGVEVNRSEGVGCSAVTQCCRVGLKLQRPVTIPCDSEGAIFLPLFMSLKDYVIHLLTRRC